MLSRSFFHVAAALVVGLSLGGCAALQEFGGKVEAAAPQINAVVSQVAAGTRRLCGFEPIAATIVGAITGGAAAGPLEVANLICNAITSQPLAAAAGKHKIPVAVVVRGVRVEGYLLPRKGR
jgi:hypothetical protein